VKYLIAQYRLIFGDYGGTGTILVNGVAPVAYYEEGTNLTISITLDAGFVSVAWFASPNHTTPISTALSFVFVMPSADTKF